MSKQSLLLTQCETKLNHSVIIGVYTIFLTTGEILVEKSGMEKKHTKKNFIYNVIGIK